MFGYFTAESLAAQVGLDGGKKAVPWIDENASESSILLDLNSVDYRKVLGEKPEHPHFHLCSGQLSFSDIIRIVPEGGKFSKGYVYARKEVNPEDWFSPVIFTGIQLCPVHLEWKQ